MRRYTPLPPTHGRGQGGAEGDTAIARELLGFIWAIARMVEPKTA
jgi:hypothetical protein